MKLSFFLINMNLGGTEKAFLSFAEELLKQDVEIELILLEKKGELLKEIPHTISVKELAYDKVKYLFENSPINNLKELLKQQQWVLFVQYLFYRIVLIKFFNKKFPFYNWLSSLMLTSEIHTTDVAIAYAGPHELISYLVSEKITARKKIQWIHFDVSKVITDTNFGNKYYNYFNQIFCVSENAKHKFHQMFPQYAHKTQVFKNIVSKNELEKLALEGETFSDDFKGIRIVTLGRLSNEKGQLMIPKVVYKLKKEGIPFSWYLIGTGNLLGAIQEQIDTLEISDSLVLLGAKLNPYRYLNDCDLYVQTSYHEGYCLTIHEAKIFNKPVVTTNVASASNLIVNNKDGLIVDISEEGVYKGVKTLLTNNELRLLFGRNLLCQETVTEIEKLNI